MRERINIDRVLDLWKEGKTEAEICAVVVRRSGQPYRRYTFATVVCDARRAGDPRAVYHRAAP